VLLCGLARVSFLLAARRRVRASVSGRRYVGGLLLGAFWILLGVCVLAAASDASRVWLVVFGICALGAAIGANVVVWPEQWARLGDSQAWRGSKR
jgi:hypothetical protein